MKEEVNIHDFPLNLLFFPEERLLGEHSEGKRQPPPRICRGRCLGHRLSCFGISDVEPVLELRSETWLSSIEMGYNVLCQISGL